MGLRDRFKKAATDEIGSDADLDLAAAEAGERLEEQRRHLGRPEPCPSCGGRGFIDQVDLRDRVQYEHCTSCGHRWKVTEAEMLADQT